MINRVLIRIKVVQLLYSYLLNRSDFSIAPAPADSSRDSQYAYSLYLDLLVLVIELSGLDVRPGHIGRRSPLDVDDLLVKGKLVKAMLADDQFKQLLARRNDGQSAFGQLLPGLVAKIKESAVFKDYKKLKERSLRDEARLWRVIITTILARDPRILETASGAEGFTNRGYDRAFEMVAATIDGMSENRSAEIEARNALDRSFDKAYELYHMLLWLCVEITDMESRRIDNAKHKYLPTEFELNPNMRFVNNSFVEALRHCGQMEKYSADTPLNWVDDDEVLVRHLLDQIVESDIYAQYMAAEAHTFEDDCELWRNIYRRIILPSDDLAEALENRSVYWNDDLDIMGTFVVKTIKRAASSPDHKIELLPKYKDDTDRRFGPELFGYALDNYDTYREYIEKFTSEKWEIDRVAFMDIVTMVVAIAELVHFPGIPVPVTVNEYVEIANAYSTAKSGHYVNGMLSSIIKYLQSENLISKQTSIS